MGVHLAEADRDTTTTSLCWQKSELTRYLKIDAGNKKWAYVRMERVAFSFEPTVDIIYTHGYIFVNTGALFFMLCSRNASLRTRLTTFDLSSISSYFTVGGE